MPEIRSSRTDLHNLADRFRSLDPERRGAMVIHAIGAQRHGDRWVFPNRKTMPGAVATYYATDVTTIAAAERPAGLVPATMPDGAQTPAYTLRHTTAGWIGQVRARDLPLRLRVRGKREADVRALLVVLYAGARRAGRQADATPALFFANADAPLVSAR